MTTLTSGEFLEVVFKPIGYPSEDEMRQIQGLLGYEPNELMVLAAIGYSQRKLDGKAM